MRALVLRKGAESSATAKYDDLPLETLHIPPVQRGQVRVRILASALNHRDLWIRKGMYPGIQFGSVIGSDAYGVVEETWKGDNPELLGRPVVLNPVRGWLQDPRGPETVPLTMLGLLPNPGTFAEYAVVDAEDVSLAPSHLEPAQAAALPLAGLTAYRAVFTKAQIQKGDRVLITGIGGGVALVAMQFCLHLGATVYVSSSSQEKLDRAIQMGAKAGVNYREDQWARTLRKELDTAGAGKLHAVIDGAGGPAIKDFPALLRDGGRIVCYGGTSSPVFPYTMAAVIKNIDLCGTSMGSRDEFHRMLRWVEDQRIQVQVDRVFPGLEAVEEAFDVMKRGTGFGKLVLDLRPSSPKM
ncbi:NAD-P-binding protein [Piptocephalis cylindrospora]|uniref:NAD-P-binding protein n=1 Tax=Piptocephalis cylindrospora TaxID=1907219 RepID=A0A4P9Y6V3_9FUNG|nr:NAD-P-binding protein [Piptocephalis cylindrospora]|eukprot:RKP14828.1 NAD-P-binding protein [Piptocephalis cylindrospora]